MDLDAYHPFSVRQLIFTTQPHSQWWFQSAFSYWHGPVSTLTTAIIFKAEPHNFLDALCVNFVPVYRDAADRIGESDIGLRNKSVTNGNDAEKGDIRELEERDRDRVHASQEFSPEVKD